MKILLFGKNGQLGWEAHRVFSCIGEVIALDYPQVDFLRPKDVAKTIEETRPDLIFNAVAYTDVDKAEVEKEKARYVNEITPREIAITAKKFQIPLIHFSTDYVFDGKRNRDYTETDDPNPLNYYGVTKLAGENSIREIDGAFFIFRTSWVFSNRQGGFLQKVKNWAKKNSQLRIVNDQIGNPTWARALAQTTALVIKKSNLFEYISQKKGIYHLAGRGSASRFEWAEAIIDNLPADDIQTDIRIFPATTDEFPSAAIRPLHSALCCDKFENTFHLKLPDWQTAVMLALDN